MFRGPGERGPAAVGDGWADARLAQTALALAALIGLAGGVYLGHSIVTIFGASVVENQVWAKRRQSYGSLHQHAADMVAPGNDIFQSRNVRPETRKFYTSRAMLNQALTNARRELARSIPRTDAREPLKDFAAVRRALKPLATEIRRVFQAFRENDVETALRRQATMNRKAAALRAAFTTLARHLDEVEDRRITAQARAAGGLARLARWIALLLVAGVGGVLVYARRADRRNALLAAEHRRYLSALRESEARKGSILASALDAIVTFDHEGRIIEFNPAAEQIFGYRRAAVMGRSLAETIVPPAQRAAHRRGLARYLTTQRSALLGRRIEVPAMRATGEEFPAEVAICEMPGPIPTFTATLRDITERKRAESELAAARDRALELARLKSEFVANMSHEIRTPMNIVFGMADMLLDSPLSAQQREHVNSLRHNAEGLLRIVDDVLDFSKVEAGKLVLEHIPFALRQTVTDAVSALGLRARTKGLMLETDVHPDVPDAVVGDPTRLRQVLLNLVDNAIKFTEAGTVTVQVAIETTTVDGPVVRFAVTDTGIGIPPEKQAAVFEAFTQVDGTTTRRYGGTGLGLTISQQLVTLMGGRMWLASEQGRGTTFFFTVAMERADTPRLRAVGGSL